MNVSFLLGLRFTTLRLSLRGGGLSLLVPPLIAPGPWSERSYKNHSFSVVPSIFNSSHADEEATFQGSVKERRVQIGQDVPLRGPKNIFAGQARLYFYNIAGMKSRRLEELLQPRSRKSLLILRFVVLLEGARST